MSISRSTLPLLIIIGRWRWWVKVNREKKGKLIYARNRVLRMRFIRILIKRFKVRFWRKGKVYLDNHFLEGNLPRIKLWTLSKKNKINSKDQSKKRIKSTTPSKRLNNNMKYKKILVEISVKQNWSWKTILNYSDHLRKTQSKLNRFLIICLRAYNRKKKI